MNPLVEFVVFSAILWTGMFAGLLWRRKRADVIRWTGPILRFNLLTFDMMVLVISFWRLDISEYGWRLLSVPLIALCVSLAGLMTARALGHRWGLEPRAHGAFVVSAAISNIGMTFGIPVCFALYGLEGQSIAGLYLVYFPFFVFIVLFTLADRWRRRAQEGEAERITLLALARAFFRDPYRMAPLAAIAVGVALNLKRGPHSIPSWIQTWNRSNIYANLFLAFLAVGFTIRLGGVSARLGRNAWLCVIKFALSPLVGIALALLIGLSGKALVVIGVLSACPVAIYAVMTSVFYDLDQEFAGMALMTTTALATLLALPVLIFN